MPEYLTTQEFADMIRTPLETIRYWQWKGKGPRSVKIGRRRLYAVEDVRAWLVEQASTDRSGGTPGAA